MFYIFCSIFQFNLRGFFPSFEIDSPSVFSLALRRLWKVLYEDNFWLITPRKHHQMIRVCSKQITFNILVYFEPEKYLSPRVFVSRGVILWIDVEEKALPDPPTPALLSVEKDRWAGPPSRQERTCFAPLPHCHPPPPALAPQHAPHAYRAGPLSPFGKTGTIGAFFPRMLFHWFSCSRIDNGPFFISS